MHIVHIPGQDLIAVKLSDQWTLFHKGRSGVTLRRFFRFLEALFRQNGQDDLASAGLPAFAKRAPNSSSSPCNSRYRPSEIEHVSLFWK
ncbi:MAG: hypothetical protein ACLQBD_17125 [Syntrophobacteraceae bacterium]